MEHLDENAVLDLLEQRLSAAERARVEAHMDTCPSCLELVAMVGAAAPELAPTEVDFSRHLRAAALQPGQVLGGRFTLDHVLGEGGMGVVWAAQDTSTNAWVALKVLKEVSAGERKRFVREGQLMQSFDHPGILDVREVVSVGDEGDVFLVMDLLKGESLRTRLNHKVTLPTPVVLNLLRSLLEATLAAHGQGVVHRDIKPENVFLRDDGQVLLLDFGMAKLTAGLDLAVSGFMTESGMILGTPHYMAPEQLHGERDVDGRADVWALGVVTYECLSGERPLTGKSFGQILRAMSRHELVDISERVPSLAPPVAELVRRMLTPDRTERPHASAVLSSLSSL